MNEQNKELLQKIVVQIKELTSIEIKPDKDWMINLFQELTHPSWMLANENIPPEADEAIRTIASHPQYNMEQHEEIYILCLSTFSQIIYSFQAQLDTVRVLLFCDYEEPAKLEEYLKQATFTALLAALFDLWGNIIKLISREKKERQPDREHGTQIAKHSDFSYPMAPDKILNIIATTGFRLIKRQTRDWKRGE